MKTDEQRFWKYVENLAVETCWEWKGGKTSDNYGSFYFRKKPMKAHRVSFVLHKGEVPKGMCVLHNCDNALCVNPSHLRLGTQLENIEDREKRGRGGDHTGEKAGLAKLTWEKVKRIRELRANSNLTQKEIALRFGVERSAIGRLLNNKTWVI